MSRRLRWIVCGVLAVLLAGLWTGARGWERWRTDAGEPSQQLTETWHVAHRIVDRHGALLRELPAEDGTRGRPQALAAVGERLVLSTIIAEDRDFYEHDGIDRGATLRAASQNLRHGRFVSGASTITQQLVKLLDTRGVPHERTPWVKLREAARAQNLEDVLDKEQILEAYLDRLPYGHGLRGPEAAAAGYFGVRSRDLSWAQATFLAVLPRAPSYLDPYTHADRVQLRQHALIGELFEAGVLSAAARDRALREPIALRPLQRPFAAPHFVEMLRAEHRLHEDSVTPTTLDAKLQRDVEGLVRTHMIHMAERLATDAAAIIVDNETGDVLAWVGSADFHDPAIAGQVDMVVAPRQPGSTLKPFVYALAFADGHTGADMLADVPTEFPEAGGRMYAPKNFDEDYLGPLPAREALAASLNVPAVRLAAEVTPARLLDLLRRLGLKSLNRDANHYGLALALGSGEVQLRELAGAYVALARGGEAVDLRVVGSDAVATGRRVLDPSIAAAVTEALVDPLARTRLLAGRSPFDIGYPLAVKTGTSSGHRDAWTVGFTHERTVVVWVGNADGDAMHRVTGATGGGPLFADIMRRAMQDVPTRAPLWEPAQLELATVCPLSGKRPIEACPDAVPRRFARGHTPQEACDIHVHARRLRSPTHHGARAYACDTQGPEALAVFPPQFDGWLARFEDGAPGKDPHGTPWLPRSMVPGCEPAGANRPTLRVETPVEGAVYWLGSHRSHRGDLDRVELVARYEGPRRTAPRAVEFVIDGNVVASVGAPYRALVDVGAGDHDVYARPTDPDAAVAFAGTRFSVR